MASRLQGLRDELGQPYIIRPTDWVDIAKASGWKDGMASQIQDMTANTAAATSLIDHQYNQQLEYRKALAGIDEAKAQDQPLRGAAGQHSG